MVVCPYKVDRWGCPILFVLQTPPVTLPHSIPFTGPVEANNTYRLYHLGSCALQIRVLGKQLQETGEQEEGEAQVFNSCYLF